MGNSDRIRKPGYATADPNGEDADALEIGGGNRDDRQPAWSEEEIESNSRDKLEEDSVDTDFGEVPDRQSDPEVVEVDSRDLDDPDSITSDDRSEADEPRPAP